MSISNFEMFIRVFHVLPIGQVFTFITLVITNDKPISPLYHGPAPPQFQPRYRDCLIPPGLNALNYSLLDCQILKQTQLLSQNSPKQALPVFSRLLPDSIPESSLFSSLVLV